MLYGRNSKLLFKRELMIEYDIKNASLTFIKNLNRKIKVNNEVLDSLDVYNLLKTLNKKDRVVETGNILKENEELKDLLIENIKEVKEIFLKNNKINDDDIIFSSFDSFMIKNQKIKETNINNYEFIKKNIYHEFLNFPQYNLIFFINNLEYSIDIKGTKTFNEEFLNEIVKPFIFSQRSYYDKRICRENYLDNENNLIYNNFKTNVIVLKDNFIDKGYNYQFLKLLMYYIK